MGPGFRRDAVAGASPLDKAHRAGPRYAIEPANAGEGPMRLKDKVAIITGAGHGMGEAEARLFAKEGAKIMVADILGGEAERVAAEIRNAGGEAGAAKIDVPSEPQWKALLAKTLQT